MSLTLSTTPFGISQTNSQWPEDDALRQRIVDFRFEKVPRLASESIPATEFVNEHDTTNPELKFMKLLSCLAIDYLDVLPSPEGIKQCGDFLQQMTRADKIDRRISNLSLVLWGALVGHRMAQPTPLPAGFQIDTLLYCVNKLAIDEKAESNLFLEFVMELHNNCDAKIYNYQLYAHNYRTEFCSRDHEMLQSNKYNVGTWGQCIKFLKNITGSDYKKAQLKQAYSRYWSGEPPNIGASFLKSSALETSRMFMPDNERMEEAQLLVNAHWFGTLNSDIFVVHKSKLNEQAVTTVKTVSDIEHIQVQGRNFLELVHDQEWCGYDGIETPPTTERPDLGALCEKYAHTVQGDKAMTMTELENMGLILTDFGSILDSPCSPVHEVSSQEEPGTPMKRHRGENSESEDEFEALFSQSSKGSRTRY
jgi:hypothetical protein